MKLTIFTPTYNRAELLKRAYNSLLEQSNREFEWLIVDDGSTDNTKAVVKEWTEEGLIKIRYFFQENGGKMRAHNRGVRECSTEWFLCLDSDDYLEKDCVKTVLECIGDHVEGNVEKNTSGKMVAGIIAHKGRSESELLSEVDFPAGIDYSTLYGLYLAGFKGETTIVFRTSVLLEFPFPEIVGEKYVPEDYIYDKIDSKYVFYVLPRILTVCEIVTSGYTDSVRKLKDNNKEAWYLYYEQRARITPMSVLKLKYLGFYCVYAKKAGHKLSEAEMIPGWQKLVGCVGAGLLRLAGKE